MIFSAVVERIFTQEGVEVLGWRPVPVNLSVVGYYAKITLPNIQQILVKVANEGSREEVETELYISRKLIEKAAESESWGQDLYICSLSNSTLVYKGMLRSEALGNFYLDLQDSLFMSSFAIYHRRYSTNTNPRWPLAQPMRFLGHNGEINTLQVCLYCFVFEILAIYLQVHHNLLQSQFDVAMHIGSLYL